MRKENSNDSIFQVGNTKVQELNNTFGEENLRLYAQNNILLARSVDLENEIKEKQIEVESAYNVDLSLADILVSVSAGVVMGICSGAFKSYIPEHGKYKHDHSTKRTAVDYKVPKPDGYKRSVQGLHRQIGPGHDLFRFREALDLISGKTKDFPLWGKTITEQTGGVLHPGGMRLEDFLNVGGFRIPDDPKAELINHLVIDFFTKTSLPIPGTSYIADKNQTLAKIMIGMYGDGFNLKNAVGSGASSALLQLIVCGYIFLFKAVPESHLFEEMKNKNQYAIKNCYDIYKQYLKSKEYHVMEMLAHGSSFLVDTVITVTSENYMGLFGLNYLSLLTFSKHTIQYVIQANKKMKVGKAEIEKLTLELHESNSEYYKQLEAQFANISNSDEIKEELSISTDEQITSQFDRLEELGRKQKEVLENFDI